MRENCAILTGVNPLRRKAREDNYAEVDTAAAGSN